MTEQQVPDEIFEVLIRLNIGNYAYQTLKDMHGLMVNFALGMEVAHKEQILPPQELVSGTFESLFAGMNHVKEMLKLFADTDNEQMQEYKKSINLERWTLEDHPETEQRIFKDPRIERLGVLVNETVEDCKIRMGGEQLANQFQKLFENLQAKDSNDPPAN